MNYNPSTIARIGDLENGIRVDTSVYNVLTYHHQDQWEFFNIYGRIKIKHLFVEFITDNGGGATLLQFNYTFTTPAITVKPLTAVSASIAALVRGSRIVCLGGAVATAAGITVATGGCSDLATTPVILGGVGFVGTVGILTTTADAVSGTAQASLFYFPMSDGAYVTAVI
jgi:hypothetical protein